MISAIVLAAGSSTRMGKMNKLLLTYKNKAIVANVVENILAGGIEDVIVVLGHEAAEVQSRLEGLPVQFFFNHDHDKGMTGSIQTGVLNAKGDGFMVCLADMVMIAPQEYTMLSTKFNEQLAVDARCICVPVFNGRKGNPVIFSSFYRQQLLQHLEPEGCREIVQSNKSNLHLITMNTEHILKDFDYPEDFEKLYNDSST